MIPAAKPTLYKDTMFRSRLEARWAAFFDLAGWRWAYEPVDLERWTPDFVLPGAANSILSEVKPLTWSEPEQILQDAELAKVLGQRTDRVCTDGLKDELLVLGNGPQRIGADWVLGVLADESWGAAPDWAVLCGNDTVAGLDFCSRSGAFAYRMGGEWDGNAHVKPINDNLPRALWANAGALVQWKGAATYEGPIGPLLAKVAREAKERKE